MKYRRNKVKREHGIIQDALGWLEELGHCPEVTDIIPGVIEVSGSPERGIVYKYPTQTGCKLLLKSNGSIQEAFVVTKNPEIIKAWVESHFPLTPEKVGQIKPEHHSQGRIKDPEVRPKEPKYNREHNSHKTSRNRKKYSQDGSLNIGNSHSSNLGQLLDSNTRQALRAFQKDLSSSSKRQRE